MSDNPVPAAFHAIACGLLTVALPRGMKWPRRIIVGAAIGLCAAAALPWVRGASGTSRPA